jgi:tRNA A-37 threonylcarbamoyl transferase component Bud32
MKSLTEKIETALKILKAAKYDFYEANLLLTKFCEIYDQELKILKESIEEMDSDEKVKELKIQIEKMEKLLKEILEIFNRYSQSIEDFLNKIEEIKQRL